MSELNFKKMEEELLNAAKEGSVKTLLELLCQDRLFLDRYLCDCPEETPLHIAAMSGHLEFVRAILTYIPKMANELDFRKSSPLHLATAGRHILVVKELLLVNPDMCLTKDCKGRNPVHIAVIKGHVEILKELVQVKPEAALAPLGASTIFHLCVKHHQKEALKYLLDVFPNGAESVIFTDEEVAEIIQTEMVKMLCEHHLVEERSQQARELGAKSTTGANLASEDSICNDPSANVSADPVSNETRLTIAPSYEPMAHLIDSLVRKTTALQTKREEKQQLENSSQTLAIVATIIATVAFDAMREPPKYSEDMESTFSEQSFCLFNTFSFCGSIFIILLLISGLPLKRRVPLWFIRIVTWITVLSIALTYIIMMNSAAISTAQGTVALFMMVLMIVTLMIRCSLRWMERWQG